VHGDVRVRDDLLSQAPCEYLLDCSAEPSVLAGVGGSPDYVIDTNLTGTINCLEAARRWGSRVVFLSTSRVYSIEPLGRLGLTEAPTRFELAADQPVPGASEHGISEEFPVHSARSLYGASKLASEYFLQEYAASYGIQGLVNRCGVLAGPWQMGKIDQGVMVLWVARHIFGKKLSYIGFGGTGKQVRDVLHVRDLLELLVLQLGRFESMAGKTYNVGGGRPMSVSLLELTRLCEQATGRTIPIDAVPENRANDIPVYLTDHRRVTRELGWAPSRSVETVVEDIARWITDHRAALEPILS
jgi:CDP-paratose 2-epimerase